MKDPLWICALSIYQSNNEADSPTIGQQLGPNPQFGPFATVLRCAVLMIAVITDACDIYTRLWYVQLNHRVLISIVSYFTWNSSSNISMLFFLYHYYNTYIVG